MVVPGVLAIRLGLPTPGASDVALRALDPVASPRTLLPGGSRVNQVDPAVCRGFLKRAQFGVALYGDPFLC